jgi:hypothetical protein
MNEDECEPPLDHNGSEKVSAVTRQAIGDSICFFGMCPSYCLLLNDLFQRSASSEAPLCSRCSGGARFFVSWEISLSYKCQDHDQGRKASAITIFRCGNAILALGWDGGSDWRDSWKLGIRDEAGSTTRHGKKTSQQDKKRQRNPEQQDQESNFDSMFL